MGIPARQVRGHVQESRMTISYAIGRNNTEGRAHTMCIEGTHGTVGKGAGAFGHVS